MAGQLDAKKVQKLRDLANKLRIHSIQATRACNSGHPTSCCSAAEVVTALFFHTMRYRVSDPRDPSSDRFVLSKGHAAPLLYAAWAEAGLFPVSELLSLRKIDSDLEGHPTPRLDFIDVATGSLGQGLGFACGMAYTGKYFDKAEYRVYCLIGDAESAEGSVWEAMAFASHYNLDNLVAIYDVNRLGQSDPTSLEHDLDTYRKRAEAFGWNTYIVDGHNISNVISALDAASTVQGKPTCILAKTFKGKGCPEIENNLNWHGKPLAAKTDQALEAISALIVHKGPHNLKAEEPSSKVAPVDISNIQLSEPPSYTLGSDVAVREGYANALIKLAKSNNRVMALDGDMKNSTYSEKIKTVDPTRHVECFVAEQNMVGVSIGCTTRDRMVAFNNTFGCFFARAYDQIRIGAISRSNINFVGSHSGCSIGEDGPSQMALEDIAIFRAIPGCTVFYPSDAVSAERATELAANTKGICFIRSSRPALPVIYNNDETFQIGKAKVVRQSSSDRITLVGSCVTLFEALKAADTLADEGINLRVVDPFTIKPIDRDTLIMCAQQTGGHIITVEDHYLEGGLGEAVASAVSNQPGILVTKLAVTGVPRSGKADQLFDMFGISASCIVKTVKDVLGI